MDSKMAKYSLQILTKCKRIKFNNLFNIQEKFNRNNFAIKHYFAIKVIACINFINNTLQILCYKFLFNNNFILTFEYA